MEPSVTDPKGYQFHIGSTDPFNECPNQIVILVHGWSQTSKSALDDFDRAAMSLDANSVDARVVGFKWNSETLTFHKLPYKAPEIKLALMTAATNAYNAGHALAKYLMDSRPKCFGHARIYIVAHSLGTAVVKSALEQLASNGAWNSNHYKLEKIFFLGAALETKTPDIKSPFGNFIKTSVLNFYNLHSPSDLSLLSGMDLMPTSDKGVLGLKGASPSITTPTNYADKNVMSLIIINDDANGDHFCDIIDLKDPKGAIDPREACVPIATIGQNHFGYWGFWDTSRHLINSGPMSLVSSLMTMG
jgi:hypothetical protein